MNSEKRMFIWAIVLPVLVLVGLTLPLWPGPSFFQHPALLLFHFSGQIFTLILVAILAAGSYLIIGIVGRRKQALLRSLACIGFCSLSLLAFLLSQWVRHEVFVKAASRSERIIQALARYRNDEGEYPEHLHQLVPRYLDNLPDTGLLGYPAFNYRKGGNEITRNDAEYELWIECTSGGFNFDRFIYWPSEDYPDHVHGGRVERIGRWAYVHE